MPATPGMASIHTEVRTAIQRHFEALVARGETPNEAAAKAIQLAYENWAQPASTSPSACDLHPFHLPEAIRKLTASASVVPDENEHSLTGRYSPPATSSSPEVSLLAAQEKYGPLCKGLAGPFQSICLLGKARAGKKLLVIDIDQTIYDPSEKGAVIDDSSVDGSIVSRCRPGLHDFLVSSYKNYDIVVWSASPMRRILMLLQQIGLLATHDYQLLAVLDKTSMSVATEPKDADTTAKSADGCQGIVDVVTVPAHAVARQQISVRLSNGSTALCVVPPGLEAGDTFHVAASQTLASLSKDCDVEQAC